MSEGEKLVWAAAFAIHAGSDGPEVAAWRAARAVGYFRESWVGDQPIWCRRVSRDEAIGMLEEMRK